MSTVADATTLERTPLYDLHLELGAKMVPFAGYEMPVQYPSGVMKEHIHTRTKAGLFDVSHMGQLRISGARAASALETVMPIDVIDLPPDFQRYSMLTNEQGGILDDLMVANSGDHFFVVVNAACKHHDLAHLQERISDQCAIDVLDDRALLALQGPEAAIVMERLVPGTGKMIFMQIGKVELLGCECYISRSGYTGEDGYEISVPAQKAEAVARLMLAQPEVAPIGLGARDSLRLEAGLCLYGHDMDIETTPVEAALAWALSKPRRSDGARPGGYPGAEIILKQLAEGVSRRRVGLRVLDRVPVREGAQLVSVDGEVLGKVTSGSFGPTVGSPVGMGYVSTSASKVGTKIHAIVRGKRVELEVAKTPFTPQRYYRGT